MKKQLTKKQEKIINDYLRAKHENQWALFKVYTNFSYNKYKAEQDIMGEMIESGGYDFYILSYNKFMFTCAYRVINDLVYHTPTQKIIIKDAFIRGL